MPSLPVAHDFTCVWCWIGLSQAKRLRQEFGVEIEWLAYEAYPEGYPVREHAEENRPSRLALAFAAEGLDAPDTSLPVGVTTFTAHTAVELAKTSGCADALVERIYRAYWMHGLDIGSRDVLEFLCRGLPIDSAAFKAALKGRRYADRIVQFDEPAWSTGVRYLPTFFLGDARLAEEPYPVLRRAVAEYLVAEPPTATGPYGSLVFGSAPTNRPYVAVNMVTTIDGKSVSGGRDEGVMDLGSKVDHDALRQIEHAAQAVLIGAATLRSTPKIRYPEHLYRFVVSRSGDVDPLSGFFVAQPAKAFLVLPDDVPSPLEARQTLRFGPDAVELGALLLHLRVQFGIETLVVEGGSELNAQLLAADLVDELFLTLAPKVKLGRDLPTYAGGEPLPKGGLLAFRLQEQHRIGDEVFLRYRRERSPDEPASGHV